MERGLIKFRDGRPECSVDLQLDLRWGFLLCCLVASFTGCQVETRVEGLVVDFELREFEYFDLEEARAHRSGKRSALRLVARERLYVMPERLRVEATSHLMSADENDEEPRVDSVIDYDWKRGVVWSERAGQPVSRQLMIELDYEGENAYRRNRLDFVTDYVRSSAVRRMPDVQFFLGDGRIEDLGQTMFAGRKARIVRLAALPGLYWEAWVLPLEQTPFTSGFEELAYLVGAMGVPPSRAAAIVERLGGLPVKITETLFSGADARVLIEGYLRDAVVRSDLPVPDDLPEELELGGQLEKRLADVDFLIDAVRHLDQLSSGLTPTSVFLKLSEHMTQERFGTALDLFYELDNAYAQVELARALLRSRQLSSWRRLREILFEDRGLLAMHLVEALIAEADARALSALMHVLKRASDFRDTDSDVVVEWALSHLRVLSGMPLAELVEYSTPGAIPDDAPERSSVVQSAELDRWFRWWDEKQASVPRF